VTGNADFITAIGLALIALFIFFQIEMRKARKQLATVDARMNGGMIHEEEISTVA